MLQNMFFNKNAASQRFGDIAGAATTFHTCDILRSLLPQEIITGEEI